MFVFSIFGSQPKEILEAGGKAADTLTQTILGSLVVILMITNGIALWLAWKSKQGEISTIKDLVNANADEKMAAKELAMAQVKAYEGLLNTVEDQGRYISSLEVRVSSLEASLQGSIAGSTTRVTEAVSDLGTKLGKRIDSLANSTQSVSVEKYYAGRD